MLSETDFKLIEAYYDGSLSNEEILNFEKKLMADPALRNAYEEQHQLVHSLKTYEREKLKNEIKTRLSKKPKTLRNNRKALYYAMAASILVLLISTIGYRTWNIPTNTHEEIFQTYFEPYPLKSNSRSTDNLSKGLLFYQNKEFANALPLLIQFGNQEDPENEYNLVIASAFLAIGEEEQAIPWAKATVASNDELFRYHGEWYLALTYFKSDSVKSKELLEKIIKSKSPYQKTAKKLLIAFED